MSWKELLDHRLLFVTGKGGTGKTSLSAAIGLRCAAEGRRTVVVEIENHAPTLPSVLGVRSSYQPQFAAPNLAVCNLTWDHALEDWLALNLPIERVRHLVLSNRIVQTFLVATPGAQETVILSKIVALLEGWDTVVVDLPASGHALSLLRVPAITIRMVRSGPIRTRALAILGRLRSNDVAILLVAMPEDTIVSETLETAERFRREVPEIAIGAVILNRSSLPSFTDSERSSSRRLSASQNLRPEDAGAPAGRTVGAVARAGDPRSDRAPRADRRTDLRLPAPWRARRIRGWTRARDPADGRCGRAQVPGRAVTPSDLLRHDLVVCVGSGGVGKTTLAAAFGVRAAFDGRRVLVLRSIPRAGSPTRSGSSGSGTTRCGSISTARRASSTR